MKKLHPASQRAVWLVKGVASILSTLLFINVPAAAQQGVYRLRLDRPAQTILGLGFEIQSDSIGSENLGLPDKVVAVPHNLLSSERRRLYTAQSIMNWFVFENSPTWFWLRALKPSYSAEASGYALGFRATTG